MRLFIVLFSLLSLPVFADSGYNGFGFCYQSLGEAVTAAAKYTNGAGYCVNGNCRILSYVPATFKAQVIDGGQIREYSIPPCTANTFSTLPTGVMPSPWYGSDPGTVSACGGTVAGSGGISGSSGSVSGSVTIASLTPEQITQAFKDGQALGWGIAVSLVIAFSVVALKRAL